MQEIGEPVPESAIVHYGGEALRFAEKTGYPVIVRPAYTLGGTGGGIAEDEKELQEIVENGLRYSPIGQCLIEQSIAGFKEIEYEVMRDAADNAHRGLQHGKLRSGGRTHRGQHRVCPESDACPTGNTRCSATRGLKIIRALDIRGGCNIQFALDPHSFQYYVIEVNPRVSRSSALASKATGYPIARMAAKIAIGYTLDELNNPVTGQT